MIFGHSIIPSVASRSTSTSKPSSIHNGTSGGPSSMPLNQEQLLAAEVGLHMLMDDNIAGARETLSNQGPDSAFALAGLGICDFLAAAVGLEDERLSASMEALAVAEKAARKGKASSLSGGSGGVGGEDDAGMWWSQTGMEYEVLIADLAAAQALLHILGESYVEYMKAVWKLNSAFKHFTSIYKAVFPSDITSNSSVSSIINDLNHRYETAQLSHAMKVQASLQEKEQAKSSGSGWGFRLRGTSVPPLAKTSASSADLKALNSKTSRSRLSSITSLEKRSVTAAASVPTSSAGSSLRVLTPPNGELDNIRNANNDEIVSNSIPRPKWTENPITSFVVSGGAFGHAIFELVFALMPPKARKMFSWLGYGSGDRKKALKLLEVAALTGTDVHGSFASLALVSYYTSILVSSGWQSDRKHLMNACHAVSDRALVIHPHGKLWLVNKAKLLRLEGHVQEAAEQLEEGLSKPSGFRQATSTLQYELCWAQLSLRRYADASEGFLKMIELNSWSHTTYYALAASCLHEIQSRTPEEEAKMRDLYEKIPLGFNRKRFMGQPPSSEVYLEKRIKFYTAKTQRWIEDGRLEKNGAEWFDSVTISMALELSLFWNQFAHYPRDSLEALIERLSGYMTSKPAVLENPEEIKLCETVLGACYITLKDFKKARLYLSQAEATPTTAQHLDEAYTYLDALSKLYGAILEMQEAEHETQKKGDKVYWSSKFKEAETKLDAIFTHHGYDMQGRLEGRAQMLRVEIGERETRYGHRLKAHKNCYIKRKVVKWTR